MIVSVATRFMLAWYGDRNPKKIVDLKSRSKLSSPKLATLPPTNESFGENVASPPANSYLEACSGARPTLQQCPMAGNKIAQIV